MHYKIVVEQFIYDRAYNSGSKDTIGLEKF